MGEFESGPIPQVVFDIADVLPQFEGEGLESQLQTFDIFLASLPPEARPAIAELLRTAAARTRDDTSRARIEIAAQAIADGGRAAAPYDHQEAMRAYRAQHAANFGGGKQVDAQEYARVIFEANAEKDPTLTSGGIGETERWVAPDGRIVAWLVVRYFRGEEDYDYYIQA